MKSRTFWQHRVQCRRNLLIMTNHAYNVHEYKLVAVVDQYIYKKSTLLKKNTLKMFYWPLWKGNCAIVVASGVNHSKSMWCWTECWVTVYCVWLNLRWVPIFVVFVEGPIHNLFREIRCVRILNPTNVWFFFNPRKVVPTKKKVIHSNRWNVFFEIVCTHAQKMTTARDIIFIEEKRNKYNYPTCECGKRSYFCNICRIYTNIVMDPARVNTVRKCCFIQWFSRQRVWTAYQAVPFVKMHTRI